MPAWLEAGAAIAGIVCALIGGYFGAHHHFEKRLANNAEYRTWRAGQLREVAYGDLYLRWLEGALAWLQEVMGPPSSARAFGVCLTLAFVYASAFLLGSWSFAGGEAGLAGVAVLPDAPAWLHSLARISHRR